MKRLLLLIAVCLSLQMAHAAGTKIGDLYYNLNSSSKTATVTYSTSSSPTLNGPSNYSGLKSAEIPRTVTYGNTTYSVTSIGDYAFRYCESLESVTIPNSIISIGSAFWYCSSLKSITIPNSVTSIGSYAFYHCTSLESVIIPNSVSSIRNNAFGSCSSLKNITIPNSVTKIEDSAFYFCNSLESVIIPNSVTSIGYNAFSYCKTLKFLFFEGSTPPVWGTDSNGSCNQFSSTPINMLVIVPSGSKNNYLSSANFSETGLSDKDIHEGLIKNSVFYFPDSNLSSLSVTSFSHASLPNIITIESEIEYESKTLPVTEIFKNSFSGRTNITSVTLPDKLKTIGDNAFDGCTGLMEANIPGSTTSIGMDAFKGTTSLTRLYLERGEEELTFPTPFTDSPVEFLFLGRDVKGTLGIRTTLKTLQVASNVNYIDANQFKGCSNLESVNIFAGNLATIKANAFEGCKALTEITIPNNVETIEAGAFKSCSALETVNLPIKLTEIADETFQSCYKLKNITLPQGITIIGKSAFANTYLPSINLPEGLTDVQDRAFAGTSFKNINLPSSLKKIGEFAFNDSALTDLLIPDNVESIGMAAFYESGDLKNVKLSNNLTVIPQSAFAYCKLEEISIPEKISIIEEGAFYDNALESINLPNSLISIGEYAFYENNLQELTIPASVKTIGKGAFADNTGLVDIYSLSPVPPTCADASVFDAATKRSARLLVPTAAMEDYMSYICWKDFTYYTPLTALSTVEIHGETDRLRVNKTLDLTLTVTPDDMTSVKVVWSSSNPAVATVDQTGHVTAISQGFTVISAKAQDIVAAEGIYPLTVINYLIGDSNDSDSVTITDAVNIASYVMGQEPDVFNFDASDVNENGVITLADASGVISIVLDELGNAQPSNSAMMKAPVNHDGKLVARSNNPSEALISLDADREMTALQADIKAANGQKIEDIIISDDLKASHSLISKRISDNEIRVVLYSPALIILPENPASLFTVKTSGNSVAAIEIDNILATGSDLNEYALAFEGGTTTGIDGNFSDSIKVTAENGKVTVSNAAGCEIRISSLHGMTVAAVSEAGDVETFSLNAGIYIVTVDGKAYKIAVR